MIYFDYASTAPVNPKVLELYTQYLHDYFANSESHHPLGTEVSKLLEGSRRKTAALLRVEPSEIVFTSGACEANSLAIKGYAFSHMNRGKHLITSSVEHSSVLNSMKQLEDVFGFEVTYLGVDAEGKIRPEELRAAIRPDTILVSVMMVNNETGSVQPMEEIKQILKEYPTVKLHMDGVQALGKMKIDLSGIDMASFAAHKIHGLKGCGVLYRKKNIELMPLISGGDQEFGIRGGTENACNYAVFGDTLEYALKDMEEYEGHVKECNRYLRERLSAIDGVLINSPDDAIPYILNISCMKLPSEVHMNALGSEGFCISSHSTCHTKKNVLSYVAQEMGITGKRQLGILRISLGNDTTLEECEKLCDAIKENIRKYGIRK